LPAEYKTAEFDEDTCLVWMSKIALRYCQGKSWESFLAFFKIKLDLMANMLIISPTRYFY